MSQEQIRRLTIHVDDLLRSYVAIHNDVFRSSLRRIIPIPRLFQAIDFNRYFIEVTEIERGLFAAREQAIRIIPRTQGLERQYIAMLSVYLDALCETVTLFLKIVLSLKLKGENKRYGWRSYKRDVKSYRLSTDKYESIGAQLNRKWRQLYLTFIPPP